LVNHVIFYKHTEYAGFGSGSIDLQLNRTETVEQKYAIVCDDEKKFNVESKRQVEWKSERESLIDLT